MALFLMQDKASEMTRHLQGQLEMNNLKQLLLELDSIFNASGNQEVSASLFESLTQKEDVPVQDYAYQLEHLFQRAYPQENIDSSPFLKQKFISGLLSEPLKIRLRSPPIPTTFRSAVTTALAHTAALYPDYLVVRNRSALYKSAVYRPNPILSLKRKESTIQAMDSLSISQQPETSDGLMEVAAIKKGTCSVHKTGTHSNKECFLQHPQLRAGNAKSPQKPKGKKSKTFSRSTKKTRKTSSKMRRRFLRVLEPEEAQAMITKLDALSDSGESDEDTEEDSESPQECEDTEDGDIMTMDPGIVMMAEGTDKGAHVHDSILPAFPVNTCHSSQALNNTPTIDTTVGYMPDAYPHIHLITANHPHDQHGSVASAVHQAMEVVNNPESCKGSFRDEPMDTQAHSGVYSQCRNMHSWAQEVGSGIKQEAPSYPLALRPPTEGSNDPVPYSYGAQAHPIPQNFGEQLRITIDNPSGGETQSCGQTRRVEVVPRQEPNPTGEGTSTSTQRTTITPDMLTQALELEETILQGRSAYRSADKYTGNVNYFVSDSTEPKPTSQPTLESKLLSSNSSDGDIDSDENATPDRHQDEDRRSTANSRQLPLRFDASLGYDEHKEFAQQQIRENPTLWDPEKVLRDPSTFYHRFFEDQKDMKRVLRISRREYAKGNYEATRSQSVNKNDYHQDAKNRLETRLREILGSVFAFYEMAYSFGDQQLIRTLTDSHFVPALKSIEYLFASSRCMTCHKGTAYEMTAPHRREIFRDRLPFLGRIPESHFSQAEDTMAIRILERCLPSRIGPQEDPYLLGYSDDDLRRLRDLPRPEQQNFHADVAELLAYHQLPSRKSRKGTAALRAPLWPSQLDEQRRNFLLHQRRIHGVRAARLILERYERRFSQLYKYFGA